MAKYFIEKNIPIYDTSNELAKLARQMESGDSVLVDTLREAEMLEAELRVIGAFSDVIKKREGKRVRVWAFVDVEKLPEYSVYKEMQELGVNYG